MKHKVTEMEETTIQKETKVMSHYNFPASWGFFSYKLPDYLVQMLFTPAPHNNDSWEQILEVQVNMLSDFGLSNTALYISLHNTTLIMRQQNSCTNALHMRIYFLIKPTRPMISTVSLFIYYLVSGFNKRSHPLPPVFCFHVNRRKMWILNIIVPPLRHAGFMDE